MFTRPNLTMVTLGICHLECIDQQSHGPLAMLFLLQCFIHSLLRFFTQIMGVPHSIIMEAPHSIIPTLKFLQVDGFGNSSSGRFPEQWFTSSKRSR